jgi:hypothetical protein
LGDSQSLAALQLADVVAGAAAYAIRRDLAETEDIEKLRNSLHAHVLPQCILPDFAMFDPNNKQAAVNASMLYRLALRAELGRDRFASLEEDYQRAEEAWDASQLR